MIQRVGLVMIVFFGMAMMGCSFSHQVNIQREFVVEEKLLPEISTSGPVAVMMKAKEKSGMNEICKAGGRTYLSDNQMISEYAISTAKDMLTRNGVAVSDSADKQLIITSLDGGCDMSGMLLRFKMDMTVNTGDGVTDKFSGDQKMMHVYERDFALSAATLNAVLEMLSDEKIQQYLKE